MNELTLIFMAGAFILYIVSMFTKRMGSESNFLILIFCMCSICAILTDDSINADMVGMLTLFPVLFIMLHSIIKIIWRK